MKKAAKEIELSIQALRFPHNGISDYQGKEVKIPHTLPGQKVLTRLKKKKGGYDGRVIQVLETAPEEIQPACPDFGVCGGCTYQNLSYERELRYKEEMVLDLLKQQEITDFQYLGICPAPSPEGYRNKMEFSFGDEEKGGALALGMRKRNSSYEVVTSRHCNIIGEDFRQILLETLDFFQESGEPFYRKIHHQGTLRNLVIRKGFFTGEMLINLVTTSGLTTPLAPFAKRLQSFSGTNRITGILHTINDRHADTIQADQVHILQGKDYFEERLLGLDFQVSAFSFFQTNSAGAEMLYRTVREFAGETRRSMVFDLYCGTGTIAQLLATNAERVVGIEWVAEAVQAAQANAQRNQLNHCQFIQGDVLKAIDLLDNSPDLIVLDPPREGLHPKALPKIAAFGAKEIIYVSCKPTSLARDVKSFQEQGYQIEKLRCHDMFPRTYHVETVVLLSRKPKRENSKSAPHSPVL